MHNKKLSSEQLLKMYNGLWTYSSCSNKETDCSKEDLLISVYYKSTHKKGYLYQLILSNNKVFNCIYRIDKYTFKDILDEASGKYQPHLVIKNFRPESKQVEQNEIFEEFLSKKELIDIDKSDLKLPDIVNQTFIKKNFIPQVILDCL